MCGGAIEVNRAPEPPNHRTTESSINFTKMKSKTLSTSILILSGIFALILLSQQAEAVNVPSSQIKTVEFFIMQDTTNRTGTVTINQNFNFTIPENFPVRRHAWIVIRGFSNGATYLQLDVTLNGTNQQTYSIDSLAVTQEFWIDYPFDFDIVNGNNGQYALSILLTSSTSLVRGISAKLVMTYEYDSTSARQLKTVRYFAFQNNTSVAAAGVATPTFSFNIPETGNINMRSAFIEATAIAPGATAGVYDAATMNMTWGPAVQISPVATVVGTMPFAILYNATSIQNNVTTGGSYKYNVSLKGSTITSLWAGQVVLTYEYDDSSTTQQKTVQFLINESANASIASATVNAWRFSIPISETGIAIQSAFIRLSGYYSDASYVDGRIRVDINSSNHIEAYIDGTTESSHFFMLYNASPALNGMSSGLGGAGANLNIKVTGDPVTVLAAELFLTYNYSTSLTNQTKTVEHYIEQDGAQRTGAINLMNDLGIPAPESGITLKSSYAKQHGVTSATAAHTVKAGFMQHEENFTIANSGETSLNYVLYNTSVIGALIYNITTGFNGMYNSYMADSSVASIQGATLITTYTYTIPSSCVLSLNETTINFTYIGSHQLTPNTTSDNISIKVSNTGTSSANVDLKGTAFAGPAELGVNNTSFAGGDSFDFAALTLNDQRIKTSLGGSSNFDAYLRATTPAAQTAGQYNQNITYTISC